MPNAKPTPSRPLPTDTTDPDTQLKANDILVQLLAIGPGQDSIWDTPATFAKLCSAAHAIDGGSRQLLPHLIRLATSSDKTQAQTVYRVTTLYNTPPDDSTLGLPFLTHLLAESGWLGAFRRVHTNLDIHVDDQMLRCLYEGIASDSANDLAHYLADRFCTTYRYGHDTSEKNMRLYRHDDALWRPEQAAHNLSGESRQATLGVLKALLKERCWDPVELNKADAAATMEEKAKKAAEKTAGKSQKETRKAAEKAAKAAEKAAAKAESDEPAAKKAKLAGPAQAEEVAGEPAPEAAAPDDADELTAAVLAAAKAKEKRDAELSKRMQSLQNRVQQTRPFNELFAQVTDCLKTRDFLTPRGLPQPAEFFDTLDADPHLIGFTNGVFVLHPTDATKFKFYRTGEELPHAAAVSMSTRYAYSGTDAGLPASAEDATRMVELEKKFFDKMFTCPEQRLAAKLLFGAVLIGGNGRLKKLFFYIGPQGNNGKSISVKIWEKCLGEYYGELLFLILTAVKKDPDGATSSLCGVTKKRVVVMHEGHAKESLNEDFVKRLTGGDNVLVRQLYGQTKMVAYQPKTVVLANCIPKVESADEAMQNRLYPVDFTSHFSSKYTTDNPAERQFRGEDFDDTVALIDANKHLFMLLMIKYCKEFVTGGEGVAPRQLPPVSSKCEAAAMLKENSVGECVRCWLEDTFVRTTGTYLCKGKTEEQKTRLMMNFIGVWDEFRNSSMTASDDRLKAMKKAEFETMLKKLGVKGWILVNNKYLEGVRKAVFLCFRSYIPPEEREDKAAIERIN